jgi:tryptophanyl-tRNA synthetase
MRFSPAVESGTRPEVVAAETGDAGSGALKQRATDAVNAFLAPHRARRREVATDPDVVSTVLRCGNARANEIASATLRDVREAMGMRYAMAG